jgi:MtrB/PioB family decaheme-associated outer membrane protein
MRKFRQLQAITAFALLIFPIEAFGQGQDQDKGKTKDKESRAEEVQNNYGYVDFGLRYATGDVYGRPDLQSGQCLGCGTPFDPVLKTSKFNEYRDVRNGFYVRRVDLRFNNVLDSENYFSFKSQSTLYRDQSYLGTFGNYGKFTFQFRYDEIPHIYSNTTRTLYTETAPGVWSYPALIRQSLQATASGDLPSVVNTQVVPQSNFITPSIIRKGGTAAVAYNMNPDWRVYGSYFRESERGLRPIGYVMNSSPSASATSGYGVELPEVLNYFNNLVTVGTEYGGHRWAIQGAYIGSFFQNGTKDMVWDNPFRLTAEGQKDPLSGRASLYPDNQANYLSFAAGVDLLKYLHFTASITPGWLRQNEAFLPYTTNTTINTCGASGTQACNSLSALPAESLHGDKQTLAMNYTLVTTAWKAIELKANFRDYDYNNNTPVLNLTPVQGDASSPSPDQNTPFAFHRKNLELTGIWDFAKRSSVKLGYEAEWMDRSHRDVAHSLENSLFAAVDWSPIKDLLFRLSYRHGDRKPDSYQDEFASDPTTDAPVLCSDTTNVSFTADQRCHRRFDEAARLLDRGDGLVQYSPSDKLTLLAFGGTLQSNFNRPGGTNSPTALNFLNGTAATTDPYYLYGVIKDLSYNYGFDLDYSLSSAVTLFGEYSHERYYKRIISRYRTPVSPPTTILTCAGCDSPNNDWESVTREPVDIYTAGADTYFGNKMIYLSTYYSLSATRGHVNSRPLGDPTIVAGADTFLLTGTNAAVDYPETVNRLHDVAVILKYKVTDRIAPRIEYHYQQWDNKDYQTSPMTQYMGCVSAAPPAAPVPGCATPILNSGTSPAPTPGATSPFYPYFVVGDPSSARYLFLGVDQPSYHAHTLMATLEYRF